MSPAIKKAIPTSLILLLLLLALVVWKYTAANNTPIPKNLNYLPIEFSTVGVNNQWILRSIQPIAGKFMNDNGVEYLEASLYDQAGKLKKFKLLIGGKVTDTLTITQVPFSDPQTKGLISLDDLRQKISPGTQIQAQIVTRHTVQPNQATQDCAIYTNFCEFYELTKFVLTPDGKLNTSVLTPKTTIPALSISLDLYRQPSR